MVAWAASVVIQGCYLHVCTERAPLEQCLAWLVRAMYLSCFVLVTCLYPLYASTGNAPIYPRLCSYCTCIVAQCVLYCASCTMNRRARVRTRTVVIPLRSMYLCLYLLYSGCMARVYTGACLLHFACVRAVRCSAWIVRAVVYLACVCVCVRQSAYAARLVPFVQHFVCQRGQMCLVCPTPCAVRLGSTGDVPTCPCWYSC